jgi:hypothetical protein
VAYHLADDLLAAAAAAAAAGKDAMLNSTASPLLLLLLQANPAMQSSQHPVLNPRQMRFPMPSLHVMPPG